MYFGRNNIKIGIEISIQQKELNQIGVLKIFLDTIQMALKFGTVGTIN